MTEATEVTVVDETGKVYTVHLQLPALSEEEKHEAEEGWCCCEEDHDDIEYYEFIEDDHRYHGWDCKRCGGIRQVG